MIPAPGLLRNAVCMLLAAWSVPSADAAVTLLREYHLGEAGSFDGLLPQDGSGAGAHYTGSTGAITTSTILPSPASGTYSHFDGSSDAFGANMATIPVDNFAIGMWVRVADADRQAGIFSPGRRADGNLRFHVENGYFAASYKGVGWIGDDPTDGGTVGQAITENEWTHLAVVRSKGVSTFYINGLAQGGTSTATPVHETGRSHLGVFNQGLSRYSGDIDEIRIFSFDPDTDNPVSALQVPEPSALVLCLGAIGCLVTRRRK
ncbi:LamG domain-containing protein [Luteolibacter yonseiensis]|uniref:LamG domain-containing protein n=2 Tax=Luteolibacter yonseiensis TaxID=1144680 RepID=A0A934R127_9BACT|nr:LamG domain-containing protein [Luteolibacter yonseiensis]